MAKRPNILLFTTDQQRGDHIGLSGHPVIETPNVDAFVNRGAYFPNASLASSHASSSGSVSTRAS